MHRSAVVLTACAVALLTCTEDDSSTGPSAIPPNIAGSWVSVYLHYYGFLDTMGVRVEEWDTAYAVVDTSEEAEMYWFGTGISTCYFKEDGTCFTKVDSVPYAFRGNALVGGFWSGSELDAGYLCAWSTTVRVQDSSLLMTYTEDESYHEQGYSDTAHEVWESVLQGPPAGMTLDDIAASLVGCPVPKMQAFGGPRLGRRPRGGLLPRR